MKATLAEAVLAGDLRYRTVGGVSGRSAVGNVDLAAIALGAFGLYWVSSFVLAGRDAIYLFGADTALYLELGKGHVVERLGSYYAFDRVTRFHPLTTALAVAWMNALAPFSAWVSPGLLLKALFATVGAAGVAAATAAFATVVPRGQARLWGMVYAASLGVWYFSSIEECKSVTATLATVYIALYLNLRTRRSARDAVLLTAVLALACLNEIVAAFLVAIPAVDALVRHGFDLRRGGWMRGWILWHGLVPPLVLAFLEGVVKPLTAGATTEGPAGEAVSHLGMLAFYVSQNDFSLATCYGFLVNWLFFNVAAPTVETTLAPVAYPQFTGYFEPALSNYLSSPVSAGLLGLLGAMLAACVLPRFRGRVGTDGTAIVSGLLAYTVLRGAFFLVVNPSECMLYGSGVTLAHLLILAIPFAASTFPGKRALLAACALLLVIVNGTFIVGT
jgi:hypothetical protein